MLHRCTLRLTGVRVVDTVVTDRGVFSIDKHGEGGMKLIELATGVSADEIRAQTEASFAVALGEQAQKAA